MMIKLLTFCAGLSLALPSAVCAAGSGGSGISGGNADRRVCHRIEQTSSRIPWRTVCKTAREWNAENQQRREDIGGVPWYVNHPRSEPMSGPKRGCCSS